jgi:hypothetical protein
MMTDEDLHYEVEAILENQSTSAKALRDKVKWLEYPKLDWPPLANLKGGC